MIVALNNGRLLRILMLIKGAWLMAKKGSTKTSNEDTKSGKAVEQVNATTADTNGVDGSIPTDAPTISDLDPEVAQKIAAELR